MIRKGLRRSFLISVLVVVILLVMGMTVYYWPKISALWEDPEAFWKLVLDATNLSDVFTKATVVTIGLFVIAAIIDIIALGWKRSGLRKLIKGGDQSVWNDLMSYLFSVIRIFDILSLIASLGLSYFLASLFLKYFHFSLSDYIQIPWIKLVVIFVLIDLLHYVQHRFMHFRPFWELHAYHHSAEEFTLLTTSRGHVLEGAIYFLFSGLFYALIGGDDLLEIIFYLNAVREGYQYLLHSDVNWHLGFVGKYILISPAAHRLHHSIDEKDYNKNYGTFFIWWDKLFKTYAEPKEFCEIGIEDNPYNRVGFLKGQWVGIKRILGWSAEK